MKLAYINILWLLFSVMGLIFLGVSPATVSLFTIIRKWFMKETDLSIFQTFVQTYRKEFIKANKLGWAMAVIGLFLLFDFRILKNIGGGIQSALSIPLFIVSILYFITLLYIFPVYVHYELKLFQYIKNSFYIGIINMHITILMMAIILLLTILFNHLPGMVPFFGISLVSIVVMWGTKQSFQRIEVKRKKMNLQN
jgi:uncharacterized membrane protein YesL